MHSICPSRWTADSDAEVEGNIYKYNPKSLPLRIINWWQVIRVHYLKHMYIAFLCIWVLYMPTQVFSVLAIVPEFVAGLGIWNLTSVIVLTFILWKFGPTWRNSVYLLDFEVATPPESWRISKAGVKNILSNCTGMNAESIDFQSRILSTSGIGDGTHWPPGIIMGLNRKWMPETESEAEAFAKGGKGSLRACERQILEATILRDLKEKALREVPEADPPKQTEVDSTTDSGSVETSTDAGTILGTRDHTIADVASISATEADKSSSDKGGSDSEVIIAGEDGKPAKTPSTNTSTPAGGLGGPKTKAKFATRSESSRSPRNGNSHGSASRSHGNSSRSPKGLRSAIAERSSRSPLKERSAQKSSGQKPSTCSNGKKPSVLSEETQKPTETKVAQKSGFRDALKCKIEEFIEGPRMDRQANMRYARTEAEEIIFPMVQNLLEKLRMRPTDIDFLVVNCSLFVPTPSLCAMICNRFKFREDICSYNLGGMGCSASVISIDLAKQLIQNRSNSTCLVVSTENLTENLYVGNNRSMMMQNTLFRCGGAAIALSSNSKFKGKVAKYKLRYSGRTFMTDDESYECVYQMEDEKNFRGVRLDRNIVTVAGRALTKQFTQLGPHVLPITEQIRCVVSYAMDFACKRLDLNSYLPTVFPKRWKLYTPNFKSCIDHFCIHAGGRAVIEGVQKNLKLSDKDVAPSFDTLKNWGNTSSSSIWYELKYIEETKSAGLKSGHQVLQIAFGSGFKCNSAVWLKL